MEPAAPNPLDTRLLRLAGAAIGVIALTAIAGWLGGWPRLTTWLAGGSSMVMNTALCALMCGIGLWLLAARRDWATRGSGVMVAAFAGVVLAQYLVGR